VRFLLFLKTKTVSKQSGRLITEMVNVVGLKPGMTFFDLGSGIGNVVIQAALVSGCSSYGIEIVDVTNTVAQDVSKVFLERCRLWGLEAGPHALYHGDFRDHETVRKHIANADVILANNFVFSPQRMSHPHSFWSTILIFASSE
jgi:H3 lysine-79-specific histone-lysine N-methyltransferase